MLKLLRYLKAKDWVFVVICAGFVVAQVYCDLTLPEYTKKLVEEIASPTMATVWRNGGFMMLYALGSAVCSIVCGFFAARLAANFAKTLRKEMFDRVTSFSTAEVNKFGTPSLITRTTNDVVQMQNFVAMGLQIMIKAPVLAVWAICKVSASAVEWTVATAVVVAVIVVVVGVLMVICLPKFRKMQKLIDELNNSMRDNITGVRVVRAFNAEGYQTDKFEAVNEKVKRTQLFTARGMGVMMPVMTICMNGLTLAVYWIGAALINNAAFAEKAQLFADMTVFSSYAMQVVMAFMLMIMIFMILPRCIVSARRICEVLGTHRSVRSGSVREADRAEGTPVLEFKDVAFAYDKSRGGNVVSDISFTVNRGETVAFIGATGSGKTTIVDLIERFYDVDSGEILFNGVNVKDYDEEVLRGNIALAPQRAVLFKGDIRGNVAYGAESVDDERINAALEVACAAEFVNGLDEGLSSPVAQEGTNFSGGQKQRLSIARAVYKNAELTVFDDTFSALDYKTDLKVRQNIRDSRDDATVIIVAQRIGTIMNADKIFVLDEGRIVGAGKHKELLESCPVYKEIALSQLSKEEL